MKKSGSFAVGGAGALSDASHAEERRLLFGELKRIDTSIAASRSDIAASSKLQSELLALQPRCVAFSKASCARGAFSLDLRFIAIIKAKLPKDRDLKADKGRWWRFWNRDTDFALAVQALDEAIADASNLELKDQLLRLEAAFHEDVKEKSKAAAAHLRLLDAAVKKSGTAAKEMKEEFRSIIRSCSGARDEWAFRHTGLEIAWHPDDIAALKPLPAVVKADFFALDRFDVLEQLAHPKCFGLWEERCRVAQAIDHVYRALHDLGIDKRPRLLRDDCAAAPDTTIPPAVSQSVAVSEPEFELMDSSSEEDRALQDAMFELVRDGELPVGALRGVAEKNGVPLRQLAPHLVAAVKHGHATQATARELAAEWKIDLETVYDALSVWGED